MPYSLLPLLSISHVHQLSIKSDITEGFPLKSSAQLFYLENFIQPPHHDNTPEDAKACFCSNSV